MSNNKNSDSDVDSVDSEEERRLQQEKEDAEIRAH